MLTLNEGAGAPRCAYPAELAAVLNLAAARACLADLSNWPRLNASATPLWQLPDLAGELGVAQLAVKDESKRSPLGSFKVLGAPIALVRLVQRLWPQQAFDCAALFAGRYRDRLAQLTAISATDGNHGRALAAAAQSIGCRCVIVLHARVSAEREQAIAAYGATIIRVAGNYDDSVGAAAQLAADNGWHVVSDTSYAGYEEIPRDVMQGYAAIAVELVEQTQSVPSAPAFTHVFLQGGVGGFAAGVASALWEYHGVQRPRLVVVEPRQADCLFQTACAGQLTPASGTTDTLMAGLACGAASPLAWRLLQGCVDAYLTVDDEDAVAAMRRLARGSRRDIPVLAGESGVAGLAGLVAACRQPDSTRALALDASSRVLLINTEGATAPGVYRQLVGETDVAVLERQRRWRSAP